MLHFLFLFMYSGVLCGMEVLFGFEIRGWILSLHSLSADVDA